MSRLQPVIWTLAGALLLEAIASVAAPPCAAQTASLLRRGRWEAVDVLTVANLKGFQPAASVALSRYGGWTGRKTKATGFFRVEKVDGRWRLIDPEGCLFVSVGLCSVNLSGVDRKVLVEKFGGEAAWAAATGALLKSNGFNTLGCWSSWRSFRPTAARMPYTPRWNFMATYKNRRDPANGPRGYPHECMPVFDPEFEAFCDEHARQLAKTRDDPWLLGHFSDNELPLRPDALTNYLQLPPADPGHRAARKWWKDRCGDGAGANREVSPRDQDAFLEYLAARYYTIVGKAIKKHDPNHLYLGSRIHGRTIRPAVLRGSASVDVVSVNYYHRWSPERQRTANWLRCSGRPFLVSEWYAQSLASLEVEASGAGFRVRTDRDRGLFYQNFSLGLLQDPGCVGWHWFKYGGDGKGFHKGVVDRACKPHEDLLRLMAELNRQVYPLVVHCSGEGKRR